MLGPKQKMKEEDVSEPLLSTAEPLLSAGEVKESSESKTWAYQLFNMPAIVCIISVVLASFYPIQAFFMKGTTKQTITDTIDSIGRCVPFVVITNAGSNLGITLEKMSLDKLATQFIFAVILTSNIVWTWLHCHSSKCSYIHSLEC